MKKGFECCLEVKTKKRCARCNTTSVQREERKGKRSREGRERDEERETTTGIKYSQP